MYQVVGFLVVGAAGAAILHSWDLPKFVSGAFLLLSLGGAALAGVSQTVHVKAPSEPISYSMADEMPPTEGFVAQPRRRKLQAETAIW